MLEKVFLSAAFYFFLIIILFVTLEIILFVISKIKELFFETQKYDTTTRARLIEVTLGHRRIPGGPQEASWSPLGVLGKFRRRGTLT